jgi:hypothetical protein
MKKRFRESAADAPGGYDDLDSGSSRPAAADEEEADAAAAAQDAEVAPSTMMSRLMAKSQKVEEDEGEGRA